MSVESTSAADASIGELMSQLSTQTSRLVRDEMRLAQKELQQSVTPLAAESVESVKADIKERKRAMADPRPEPGPEAEIDDLQTDIEQTRKELGETVEALSAKMDVKQRTKDKAAETKEAVVDKAAETKDRVVDKTHAVAHATIDDGRAKVTVPVAAVVVVGVAALVWFLRRRR